MNAMSNFSSTSCLNDSSGPGTNKILFTLKASFYEENVSESVHLPDGK